MSENDEKPEMVDEYLKLFTDVEICQKADQGDPPADYIFHVLWSQEKQNKVASKVDNLWKKQWD